MMDNGKMLFTVVAALFAGIAVADALPVTGQLVFHVDAGVSVTTNVDGRVTSWADQSVSGKNLTSSDNRPILHETACGPAVYFNGSNYLQTTENFINYQTHTVILVAKSSVSYTNSAPRPGDLFASNISGGTTYTPNKDILVMCNWDADAMFRYAVYCTNVNRYVKSSRTPSTDLAIAEQCFDGETLAGRINGVGLVTLAVSDFTPVSTAGVNLGGRPGLKGMLFHGDIYEVLVYNRAITDTERKAINRYLGTKWNVPGFAKGEEVAVTDGLTFRMDASLPDNFTTNAAGAVLSYFDGTGVNMLEIKQGTDSQRPAYHDTGGAKSIYFDGSDFLASSVKDIQYATHNIFIVVKPATTNQMGDLYLGDTAGDFIHGGVMMMCNWDETSVMRAAIYKDGATNKRFTTKAKTTDIVILEQWYDGTTLHAYANGSYSEGGLAVTGFSQLGGVNLGGRATYAPSSQLFHGDMYEALVYDRALSQLERYRVLKQLYEKWGVEDAFKATIDEYIAAYYAKQTARAKCPLWDGLQCWVAADEAWSITTNVSGEVTAWADISSNEHAIVVNASGTAPVFKEKGYFLDRPCVRLNEDYVSGLGGKDGLYGAAGKICYSNHTIFVVAKPGGTVCGEDMFSTYVYSGSYTDGGILMLANKNSHVFRGSYAISSSNFLNTGDSGLGASRTTPTIYEQRMTDSELSAAVWSLGSNKVSKAVTKSFASSATKTGFALGGRFTNGYGWNGSFAEVMVYDRALSAAEIEQVETYLRDKWFSYDFAIAIGADGEPVCVTITDATAFPSGGTVTLSGDMSTLKPGVYDIVTAAGVSAAQTWALVLQNPTTNLNVSLSVTDGKLVLRISKKGTLVSIL